MKQVLLLPLLLTLFPASGTAQDKTTPVQLVLEGTFTVDGGVNLQDSGIGIPRSYTIPAGFSKMLIKYVSCQAIAASGTKVQIFLQAQFLFPSVGTPASLVELIPDNEIFGVLPQPRQVAHATVNAYLGITTPDGPSVGNTLTLAAQRDTLTGTGGVVCVVSGELFAK